MANETGIGALTTGYDSVNFPAVATAIETDAFKMLYESTLMPKLFKHVGQGQKGTAIHYPYFSPATFAAAGSGALLAATDYTTYTQLTNASVYFVASEFGIASFLLDPVAESMTFNAKEEIARQQGIGVSVALEKHCLARISATSGASPNFDKVITATSADGLTYTKIAACKTLLDAKVLTVSGEKNLVVPEYAYYYTAKGTYSTTYQAAIPTLGDEVLQRWHITTAFGDVRIFRNNHITVTASGANDYAKCPMFVKDAVGYWEPRSYRLEGERDASKRGTEFISTMRAGAKILQPTYGLVVVARAEAPS